MIYIDMEQNRHKTHKKGNLETEIKLNDTFKTLLEDSAKEAYSRPWHRL